MVTDKFAFVLIDPLQSLYDVGVNLTPQIYATSRYGYNQTTKFCNEQRKHHSRLDRYKGFAFEVHFNR